MEINPIVGIRAVPAVKSARIEPELSAVFEIDHASESLQDTFAQNEGKMTGGQDDETAEPEETLAESSVDTTAPGSESTVNFFA